MAYVDGVISLRRQQTRTSVPHCIRLLPENRPQNRAEALAYRLLWPDDPRAYLDHEGRYLYDTRPLAMRLEDAKKDRWRRLQDIQDKLEIVKTLMGAEDDQRPPCVVDFDVMRHRMTKAHKKTARENRGERKTSQPTRTRKIHHYDKTTLSV
ncbi:uncharacterized protein LOC101860815 [Aplysia californica]|uniref:Uncharacterized protein LOC101860815 n=1 Tax=Aplysia californica TaxID=6500 RepID=A0ABM0JQ11_APLCA|nr:uncharacterized protein LOC101860815 [Aplysia californica]